jgi:hypothetical protein
MYHQFDDMKEGGENEQTYIMKLKEDAAASPEEKD